MTPYYSKDGITIYNCMTPARVMPDLPQADLLLTLDPPYGINGCSVGSSNARKGKGRYDSDSLGRHPRLHP